MPTRKGFFALLLGGLLYGSYGIWVRWLGVYTSPYQQIFIRSFFGLFLAVAMTKVLGQSFRALFRVKWWWLILFALSFQTGNIFFTTSIVATKVAITMFAFYLGSFITSFLLSRIVFKEKITGGKLFALFLALSGLGIMVVPTGFRMISWGFIAGFFAGVMDTVSNGFRKFLGRKIDKFPLVMVQMIGGVCLVTLLMGLTGQTLLPVLPLDGWLAGVIYGLVITVTAYVVLIGFSNYDMSLGTIVISSELFFAVLFAALVFHEIPTLSETVGSILIFLAIVSTQFKSLRAFVHHKLHS